LCALRLDFDWKRPRNVFCKSILQENYVEYSRHGTLLKGIEKAKVKSCYEEDVYEKNHTVSSDLGLLKL